MPDHEPSYEEIAEFLAHNDDEDTPDPDYKTARNLALIFDALLTRYIAVHVIRRAFRRFGIELSRAQVAGVLASIRLAVPRNPTRATERSVDSLADALLPLVRASRTSVENFILARASRP